MSTYCNKYTCVYPKATRYRWCQGYVAMTLFELVRTVVRPHKDSDGTTFDGTTTPSV